MTYSRVIILGLGLCLLVPVGAPAAEEGAGVPEGFTLQYEQNFDSAAALEDFQFSDPNAWRWTEEGGSGSLELHGKSDYATEYRSPFNIALIDVKAFGDFVLEADLMQTGREYGHRDMCLFFDFISPTEFYYTHIATAPDPHAHNIFIVNKADRRNMVEVPEKGVDWATGYQHVRLERIGGEIRVFFNDLETPVLQHEDATFTFGHVGFGSFDDTGRVDNIRIWAKDAKATDKDLFPKK